MKYTIQFQYKPTNYSRPQSKGQDETIVIEDGGYVPLPDIGDSVSYQESGRTVSRKVLTRHFSYRGEWCDVNIVVTDLDRKEMSLRLKE